ncbi:MAG: hypothetical protein EA398_09390 [Deltaproteobacteria bacterium]|nr:MAG: hypothetical protein EA398_09390 [Deltaproteobacteria bacterium]
MRPARSPLPVACLATLLVLNFSASACPSPVDSENEAQAPTDEASHGVTAAAQPPSATDPAASPSPESSVTLPWETTHALVEDPALRAAVDLLATFPAIESARIGSGGDPSEAHAAFRAVVDLASPVRQLALLRHESPVVRGYLLEHVLPTQPVEDDLLRALLADETAVPGQIGCILGTGSIASRSVEALCRAASDAEHVPDALERAARWARPDPLQARAVVCLASRDAPLAVSLALPRLDAPDPQVRRQAVSALILADASEHIGRIAPLARDADHLVRATVATALGRLGGDRDALVALTRDEEGYVRQLAGSALVPLPDVDTSLLETLLADPVPRVRHGVARQMAEHGVELALVEAMLLQPRVDGRIMQTLAVRDEPDLVSMMRRLADAEHHYVRERALDWLGEHGDISDLPRLRDGLRDATIGARRVAAEALARRGDTEAIPLLHTMLREDENPHGRIAAAGALLVLEADTGRQAVERAASVEPAGWARTILLDLLREHEPPVDLQAD